MTTQTPGLTLDPRSPLGYGLLATYCTVALPYPDGSGGTFTRSTTTVQLSLGIGTNPKTGATIPSTASGRTKLVGDLLCRLSCRRGGLVDTRVPTTTAQYGANLMDYVGADMSASDVGQLAAAIDAQLQMDERVIASTTTGTLIDSTLVLSISVTDGAGPFKLTLAIDLLTQDLSVLSSP